MFREDLLSELLKVNTDENEEGFSNFPDICKKILNYHVPCEQKYTRENHLHLPFINKTFSKKIRNRNRLRNKLLKIRNGYNEK